MITQISSASHLSTTLSKHTLTIADFYADWCGPCRAIAPVFSSLATKHAKPGKLAFVKIDVDAQADIARTYSVSAMPTFLILSSTGATKTTLRGADPSALRSAVEAAAKEAGASASATFAGKGHTLGSSGPPSSSSSSSSAAGAASRAGTGARTLGTGAAIGPWAWMSGVLSSAAGMVRTGGGTGGSQGGVSGALGTVVRFVGLYVTTLFSLDAYRAAEESPFNVRAGQRGGSASAGGGAWR